MLKHAAFAALTLALLLAIVVLVWPQSIPGAAHDGGEAWLFGDEDDAAAFGGEPEADLLAPREQLLAIDPGHGDGRRALIRSAGRAEYYRPRDRLADGRSELFRILDDAVLLRSDAVYRLLCCVAEPVPDDRTGAGPELVDLRNHAAATDLARDYHSRLYRNPFSLIGAVEVEASRDSRGVLYRIFPGRDPRVFNAFGLEPGDTVLGLNGISLAAERALPRLLGELAEASHVAVTLRRAGRDVVILLALDENA